MPINLTDAETNVRNSGFVLEHLVTEKLKEHNWLVINGKYYLDDVAESAREIDLVAYKASEIPSLTDEPGSSIHIYTALIISCKKNDKNFWGLLFREYEEKNPNINWFPLKFWTNLKSIEFISNSLDFTSSYLEQVKDYGIFSEIFEPTGHLFAFQEFQKSNSKIQNDKQIFEAISSLMKAESYEMNTLQARKKEAAIYNFNLISIADTELVKLDFNGIDIKATEINDAKTTFNYIVNKKQTASRIHFTTFNNLDSILNAYQKLHTLNFHYFKNHNKEFFQDIFITENYKLFLDEFNKDFLRFITASYVINHYLKDIEGEFDLKQVEYLSLKKPDLLEIGVPDKYVKPLNQLIKMPWHKQRISLMLKNIFSYSGNFIFSDEEIPF